MSSGAKNARMFAARIPNSAIPRSTSMNWIRSASVTGPTCAASAASTPSPVSATPSMGVASVAIDHPRLRHHAVTPAGSECPFSIGPAAPSSVWAEPAASLYTLEPLGIFRSHPLPAAIHPRQPHSLGRFTFSPECACSGKFSNLLPKLRPTSPQPAADKNIGVFDGFFVPHTVLVPYPSADHARCEFRLEQSPWIAHHNQHFRCIAIAAFPRRVDSPDRPGQCEFLAIQVQRAYLSIISGQDSHAGAFLKRQPVSYLRYRLHKFRPANLLGQDGIHTRCQPPPA